MTDPMSTPPAKTSTGLEPNVAAALSYSLGWLTGLVFFFIEKDNKFVRFHAMQSIIVFGGLTLVYLVLAMTLILAILTLPLLLVQLVLWVLLMVKAFQGEMFKLPWVGNIAEQQMAKM